MAPQKFLTNNAGQLQEVAANASSAGAPDAGKLPALDGTGRLDTSFMPVGIGADTAVIATTEALSAGNFVNIYDGGSGVFKCRKADGSTTKPAHGFVLASVASAANATIYLEGQNTQLTGLVPGDVFLSDSTPGGTSPTAPTTSGHLVQRLGTAVSATAMDYNPSPPITLA